MESASQGPKGTPEPKKKGGGRYAGPALRPVRRKHLVKAVIENGGNLAKASKSLGMPRQMAYDIVKDDEFKDELKKQLAKYNIGVERFAQELDKGLKEGKVGSHQAYVEMLKDTVGLTHKDDTPKGPGVQVNLLFNEAKKRGLA